MKNQEIYEWLSSNELFSSEDIRYKQFFNLSIPDLLETCQDIHIRIKQASKTEILSVRNSILINLSFDEHLWNLSSLAKNIHQHDYPLEEVKKILDCIVFFNDDGETYSHAKTNFFVSPFGSLFFTQHAQVFNLEKNNNYFEMNYKNFLHLLSILRKTNSLVFYIQNNNGMVQLKHTVPSFFNQYGHDVLLIDIKAAQELSKHGYYFPLKEIHRAETKSDFVALRFMNNHLVINRITRLKISSLNVIGALSTYSKKLSINEPVKLLDFKKPQEYVYNILTEKLDGYGFENYSFYSLILDKINDLLHEICSDFKSQANYLKINTKRISYSHKLEPYVKHFNNKQEKMLILSTGKTRDPKSTYKNLLECVDTLYKNFAINKVIAVGYNQHEEINNKQHLKSFLNQIITKIESEELEYQEVIEQAKEEISQKEKVDIQNIYGHTLYINKEQNLYNFNFFYSDLLSLEVSKKIHHFSKIAGTEILFQTIPVYYYVQKKDLKQIK